MATPKPIRKEIKKLEKKDRLLIKKVSENKSHAKGISKMKSLGKTIKEHHKDMAWKK